MPRESRRAKINSPPPRPWDCVNMRLSASATFSHKWTTHVRGAHSCARTHIFNKTESWETSSFARRARCALLYLSPARARAYTVTQCEPDCRSATWRDEVAGGRGERERGEGKGRAIPSYGISGRINRPSGHRHPCRARLPFPRPSRPSPSSSPLPHPPARPVLFLASSLTPTRMHRVGTPIRFSFQSSPCRATG